MPRGSGAFVFKKLMNIFEFRIFICRSLKTYANHRHI
ncbi:MAG: hypothetical protein K0Q95_1008 [Bacteroidota bacterium]|jgi:hypothetical protein|nr:hypothetical protein [Bacteroidota bacterium]